MLVGEEEERVAGDAGAVPNTARDRERAREGILRKSACLLASRSLIDGQRASSII